MDIDLIKKTGEGQMSCLLSCCFTSGIIFSRTLNPEKPQNVEPQNTAQGDLALPGVKMNAGAVSCILHFPLCTFPPACRDGAQRCGPWGLGTSGWGQKPNPAPFAVGDGVLAPGHPFLPAKQLPPWFPGVELNEMFIQKLKSILQLWITIVWDR